MSDLARFEGFDLRVVDGEPRVLDVQIAERAGLERPRSIRHVIKRNQAEMLAHGSLATAIGNGEGRNSNEFWLNEAQAISLTALLRTEAGRKARIVLVKAFVAQRRETIPTLPVVAEIANAARMGDSPEMKAQMVGACVMAARAARTPLRKVHGFIRRTYRVSSPYFLAVVFWPQVRQMLVDLAMGRLALTCPTPRRLPGSNVRQLSFPDAR